jgi:tetratricopeptide (TPR) repeat protein
MDQRPAAHESSSVFGYNGSVMNKRRTRHSESKRKAQTAAVKPAVGRKRSIMLVIVLVSLGVGAVVVERLTRPRDSNTSPEDLFDDEQLVAVVPLVPPPPAEPGFTETVTEGKQLGAEIAEQFPDDPQALALAGEVQFTFANPDEAQDNWQRTIELDPRSAQAWLGMAKLAYKQGDFDRAVQTMQRLGEIAPAVAESQVFFLVDSLLKLGRPQEVVDLLPELGQSASLPSGARVALAQAYCQLQDYEQAADQYRQALDDPQQASVAHYGLSRALMRLGRRDEAQRHLQQYQQLQEENMVLLDRMQGTGSAEERNDPKPLYPLLAGFHFETAKAYAIRGQRDPAEEHAYRAWALAPNRPEPRLLLESFRQQ